MTPMQRLAALEGRDELEILEEASFDSVALAICKDCDYTDELEPDGTMTCPDCGGQVKSCLLWAGIL